MRVKFWIELRWFAVRWRVRTPMTTYWGPLCGALTYYRNSRRVG